MARPKKIEEPEVLKKAREILMRDGVPGASKKIAAAAGISEGALFGRYKHKADLLVAALAPPDLNTDKIIAKGSPEREPLESLVENAERLLTYFREAVPRLLPILGEPVARRQEVLNRLGENPALKLRAALKLFLLQEANAKRISKVDSEGAATLLVFALYSVALFETLGLHPRVGRTRVEALVDSLWHGLQPHVAKKSASRQARGLADESRLI